MIIYLHNYIKIFFYKKNFKKFYKIFLYFNKIFFLGKIFKIIIKKNILIPKIQYRNIIKIVLNKIFKLKKKKYFFFF